MNAEKDHVAITYEEITCVFAGVVSSIYKLLIAKQNPISFIKREKEVRYWRDTDVFSKVEIV